MIETEFVIYKYNCQEDETPPLRYYLIKQTVHKKHQKKP